jgi:hypothetical protein
MASSDFVRAFPYPVWEEGNLSFPHGSYQPKIRVRSDGYSAEVEHELSGMPLIEQMLSTEHAAYVCSISVPITSYRSIEVSTTGHRHTVVWNKDHVGEPPYLRPFIACLRRFEHTLKKADGVSEAWHGKRIRMEKGARLVLGPFFRTASSLQHLLSVVRDPNLKAGTLRLEPASNDGFYFRVHVAEDLFAFIQRPADDSELRHSRSILTHAISCCFEHLRKQYGDDGDGDDGWRSFRNLVALAEEMERKDLKIWNDPDFSPEQAATALHPHRVPSASLDTIE